MTPSASARADADKRGEPIATGYTHCLPDGMPSMMMAMFPMEVLQTKGQITIIQEAYNQVRRIYLNDTLPAIEDAEPGFWGHSAGHWEGDTFVVDTVGIKESRAGSRHAALGQHAHPRRACACSTPDHFENEVTVDGSGLPHRPVEMEVGVPAPAELQDVRVRLRGQSRVRRSETGARAPARRPISTVRLPYRALRTPAVTGSPVTGFG